MLNWQNVITGKYLLFSSHYYPATVLFAFLIFAVCAKFLADSFLEKNKIDIKRLAVIIFMIVLFAAVAYRQKSDIRGAYLNIVCPPDISSRQSLMPVADWLNKNTPKDSAIYALGSSYEWLIPVYTQDNVYWHSYAGFYLISDEELENRWVVQNFFNNVTEKFITSDRGNIWAQKFVDARLNKEVRRKIMQFITGKTYPETALMDQAHIDRVLEKSQQFKKMGFEKALKIYAADYVLLDLNDKRYASLAGQFGKYGFLEWVANIGSVVIFRVK